jgi:hypothetical protein
MMAGSAATASAQTYLFNSATFETGLHPVSVVAGDFDGDKRPDLALSNSAGNTVSVLLGSPGSTFQASVEYATGTGPEGLALGDFNGDSKPDLVVAHNGDGTVSILLGNGDGTFSARRDFPTAAQPTAVAVGDFNHDGKQDLAVATSSGISVLLGNGDGTFQTYIEFASTLAFTSIAVSDFNGDGRLDLVATDRDLDMVSVLIGNGDGTFQAPSNLAAGFGATGVIVADFNGDGKQDLAVANYFPFLTNVVSIFLGNGDGTFQSPSNFGTGGPALAIVAGDFNNDGRTDLAVGTFPSGTGPTVVPVSGTISILLGNGDGTFQAHRDYGGGALAVSLTAADLNGDGQTDLAVADSNADAAVILLGDGRGGFGRASDTLVTAGGTPNRMATGDFNADGKADVVVGVPGACSPQVFLGNGDGTFATPTCYSAPATDVTVADFNGDGKQDFAVATGSTISVFLGNGNGTFQSHVDSSTVITPFVMTAGDFNHDGKTDLALGLQAGNTEYLGILLGNGDGTFQPIALTAGLSGGAGPNAIVAADVNGDGKVDLALASSDSISVVIFLGKGDGTFTASNSSVSIGGVGGIGNHGLVVTDLNGDGKLDLVVSQPGNNTIAVLVGNGDGTFQSAVNYPSCFGPSALSAADIDGDGKRDLVVGCDSGVSVLRGNGDGTFQSPAIFQTWAHDVAVVATDFNGDGRPDIAITTGNSTFSVLLNTPAVALDPAGLTFPGQPVGTASAAETLSVFNAGIIPLRVSSISITGSFSQTNNCPNVIPAGSKCTVEVTYQPSVQGTETGTLTIGDNSPTSPHSIHLTGLGTARRLVVTASPSSLTFSGQFVGTTSAAQVLTLSNTGNVKLTISGLAVTGANGGDFSETNTCGTSVAASANCTVSVTFKPTAAGNRTASITVTDDASNSPQTVSLSGSGTDFSLGPASGASTSATLTAGQSTTLNLQVNPISGFTGAVNLTCSGAPAQSTCIASTSSVNITGPSSAPFSVTVTTTARGLLPPSPIRRPWQYPPQSPLQYAIPVMLCVLLTAAKALGGGRLRLVRTWVTAAAVMVCLGTLMTLSGCSGGGSSPPPLSGTPAGTYTLTVTGTSQGVSRTVSLTLTIN